MSRYINIDSLGIGKANPDVFENKAYADGWNSAIDIIEKSAHRRWWSGMSDNNKKIIKEIPNFDIDVFCDITGIDKKKVEVDYDEL